MKLSLFRSAQFQQSSDHWRWQLLGDGDGLKVGRPLRDAVGVPVQIWEVVEVVGSLAPGTGDRLLPSHSGKQLGNCEVFKNWLNI